MHNGPYFYVFIYFFSFHTYDYARHFVSACTRILGLEGTPEGVEDQGRLTRVAAVCILAYQMFEMNSIGLKLLYSFHDSFACIFSFPLGLIQKGSFVHLSFLKSKNT